MNFQVPPPPPLALYQRQNSPLTLREGLAELVRLNPGLTAFEPGDPGADLFLPHDACHVVFGLGTSVLEESLVDYWTLFGSDIPFKTYLSYSKHLAKVDFAGVGRRLGWRTMGRELGHSVAFLYKIIKRTRRMKRPWTFTGYTQYMDTTLAFIRRDFGIEIIRVPNASRSFSTVAAPNSAA